jgi:peptide/nickel transport system permease protein
MAAFPRFLLRRMVQIVPVVVAIAALNFLLLSFAPGDAADIISAQNGGATAAEIADLRHSLGLDLPLPVRFLLYMRGLLTLNLGYSHIQGASVLNLVASRIPATLLLMVTALTAAILIGTLLGILAAMMRGRWLDRLLTVGSLLIFATPHFWLALMMIVIFSVKIGILPSGGMATIDANSGLLAHWLDVATHLILPATTLAMFYIATYARLMRTSMLEVLGLDYITAARARGASERSISFSHAARNAVLPVVTLAGVQIGHALGGSILIETVFGWPGLGRLVFDSLLQRDIPVLMGILLISSILVIVVSLAVDIISGLLDPRIVYR